MMIDIALLDDNIKINNEHKHQTTTTFPLLSYPSDEPKRQNTQEKQPWSQTLQLSYAQIKGEGELQEMGQGYTRRP